MSRALGAVATAVVALAGGCTSSDDHATSAAPSSSTTSGVSPSSSARSSTPTAACRGLGNASTEGDVTWVVEGMLFDRAGCLLAAVPSEPTLAWGGKADRVVVGGTVVIDGTGPVSPLAGGRIILSTPTGTAVLQITDSGRLLKRGIEGGQQVDITFLARHETAVYHPAGRSIVSSGTDASGGPALVIADNVGRDPRPLLEIEEARHVDNPSFTATGALLYTADHGDHVDLHRLEIGENNFSTIDSVTAPGTIDHVTTSPFSGGGVAWTIGSCSSGEPILKAERSGRFLAVGGTEAEHARPVGWLPNGSLVAVTGQACQRTQPGKLLVLHEGEVDVMAEGVTSAAVRAVLPPPPAPPKSIPQRAPA